MEQSLRQPVIPGLDAARALAILLVIFFHFGWTVSGSFGVVLFFVLSGFLITGILLREFTRTGAIRLKRFYLRRAFRIFPAFYVAWTITILQLIRFHTPFRWSEAFLSFFYLGNYGRALVSPDQMARFPMTISWTLAVEEQFYLLWPVVLVLLLKKRPGGNTGPGLVRAANAALFAVIGIWIYRAILILVFHVSAGYVSNAFETRADALMLGSLLAILTAQQTPRWMMAPALSPWFVLTTMLGVFALGPFSLQHFNDRWFQAVDLSVQALLAVILMWQFIYVQHRWPWLTSSPVRYVARISYSLYLYNVIAVSYQKGTLWGHLHVLVFLFRTFALATLSYFLIERPFLSLRDRNRAAQSVSRLRCT